MSVYTNKPHCETYYHINQCSVLYLRSLSESQRGQRYVMIMELAEKRLRTDILRRHPDISAYELKMRIGSHRVPADLMLKAYGWNPELTDDRYDKEHELEEQLRQVRINNFELCKLMQFAEAQREPR